jgi:hypothetical protein
MFDTFNSAHLQMIVAWFALAIIECAHGIVADCSGMARKINDFK